MRPLLVSLRPVQWSKNLFVLAPIVFAERLTDAEMLIRAAVAFTAFSAGASAIYLVNDLRDRERDRLHPIKSRRPLAAGTLKPAVAVVAAALLALGAFASEALLGPGFAIILAVYFGLNLGYSFGLKNIVILDVMIVASGYVLRVAAGGVAVQVDVSTWILLCTTFFALFLVFSKRRHEIMLLAGDAANQRAVLHDYSPTFLDQMINVVTASTLLSYALYTLSEETVAKFGGLGLVYTIPFVLFGIFRYLYLVYQATNERNPTEAVLTDVPSVLNFALWSLTAIAIIYVL